MALFASNISAQTYRVLPLGNSLTQGWGSTTIPDRVGYRYQFYNDLTSGGYSFDLVGHRSAGYDVFTDSEHSGIPDTRDQHILELLQTGYDVRNSIQITPGGEPYLDFYPAEMILLHIGTNDILNGEGTSVASVSAILDEIDAWESANGAMVIVFLAKIVNTAPNITEISDFNNNLELMVAGRGDPDIILVDMETGAGINYGSDFETDGVHLLQSGYDKMGTGWSDAVITYLTTPPVAPTGLTFTDITPSSMTLNWTDNSGNEEGFEVYRSNFSLFGYSLITTTSAGAESYQDNGLAENTTYFYRVRAVNSGGASSDLVGSSTTFLSPPDAPSGLYFNNVTNSSIQLNWSDNSSNEAGFEIYRATSLNGSYSLIETTAAGVISYVDLGLNDDTEYFYRVNAFNAGGSSDYVAGSEFTLPDPPSAPSNLGFSDITSTSIRLNWRDRSGNEDGFEIHRATSLFGSYAQVGTVSANIETFEDTGLSGNTRYYYRVYAYNDGGLSDYVSGSEITSEDAPAAPSSLSFSGITSSSLVLNWSDNSDNETGFEIRRSNSATGTFILITTTPANAESYQDNGLQDDTEYFYRLNAVNSGGASDYISGSATTLLAPPDAPSNPQALSTSTCTVDLSWQDNSDNETGFRIERSKSLLSGYSQIAEVGSGIESYSDNTTENNTSYYYRIYAYNVAGNSDYSPVVNTTINVLLQGGVIGPDQSICLAGDPARIDNIISPSGGSGNWSYQWQSRPLSGSFADIPGANSLFYDPPSGMMETTEFIRVSAVECGSVASNTVTIDTEDIEPPLFVSCPADILVNIERDVTFGDVTTPDPVVTDNCGVVVLTWSLAGATSGNSPATGLNTLGTYPFNLGTTTVTYVAEDLSGNSTECSFDVVVELSPPTVVAVSIPNVIMGIGNIVTATITVRPDGGDVFTMQSGSVGGYPLYGFQRINPTTYFANFEVVEGGNSYLAAQSIPVEDLVITDGVVDSDPYNGNIIQNSDPLDAELPVINAMQVAEGIYGIGDAVQVTINADGLGYLIHPDSEINGMLASEGNVAFAELGGGNYRLSYIVGEGDGDVAPGDLQASVILVKPSGNENLPYTNLLNADAVTIDASAPVVTQMEVGDEEVGVGGIVQVAITADGEEYTAAVGTLINGIPLSSPRVEVFNRGGGLYELSYTVAEEDMDVEPGALEIQLLLEDLAGNLSLPFQIIEPNLLEVYTQLPVALVYSIPEICEGEIAELSVFLEGRGPFSLDLFDGVTTTTYGEILQEVFIIPVSPVVNTTYSVTEVRDVNEVVNTGGGATISVNQADAVEIINLNPAYNVEADPVQLEANIPGGVFTGPGVFTATGIFDPGVADTVNSPHSILYTYQNNNNCISVDTALVYVLGAQGAIIIPSDLVCSNSGPFDATAFNASGAVGQFRLLDGSGQVVNGITDNGDNTATIDPGLLSDGAYIIDYQYVDQVLLNIQRPFAVESVAVPTITNLDLESYCQNVEPFLLLADMEGAVIEGPGVTFTEDGYLFNPADVTPGEILITCTNSSTGGCLASSQRNVFIDFAPEADFAMSATCIADQGDTVSFKNLTDDKLMIESWLWNFGDPSSGEENESDQLSPKHYYSEPGERTISLTATATSGCISEKVMNVSIGNQPVAAFSWSSDCYRDDAGIEFINRSVSESSAFDTLVWRFKTPAGILLEEIGYRTGMDTLIYSFDGANDYQVELFGMNVLGCSDSVSHVIKLKETISLKDLDYHETFNTGEGSWSIESDDQIESWVWDQPDFTGFEPTPGDRAWFTRLPEDIIDYQESSWVQSPCFDFTGVKRPMIELDIMRSFMPLRDGSVLQYQIGRDEGWQTLGGPESGIEWYSSFKINNLPGGSETGWGLEYYDPDHSWVRAIHDLDKLAGKESVMFRIAIGTEGVEGVGNQGFAFDNIMIGERSKLVVLEHFTNSSDAASKAADDVVDTIAFSERGDLVDLQYHMSYPGFDPMNENNPDPASVRSFNYGVPSVPYAVIDGGVSGEFRYDFSELKATPNNDQLNLLSLQKPLFDVELDVSWMEGSLETVTTVTCRTDRYTENIQLYIVVMETEVTAYTGLNGDQSFRNVVLDMIPLTGKLLGDNWFLGTSDTRTDTWTYPSYVEDPEELAVVAFVQDRTTNQVLQAAADYRTPQVGIGDTPFGVRTLQLYPNPGISLVHVNLGREALEDGRIEIIDMNGRVVQQTHVPMGYQIYQLDIGALDRGLYMVQWFEGENLRAHTKLVKVD